MDSELTLKLDKHVIDKAKEYTASHKRSLSRMILQVHDELVFDAHQAETDALKSLVEKHMKEALPLSVPVVVEVNTGTNWLEAH